MESIRKENPQGLTIPLYSLKSDGLGVDICVV